MQPFQNNKTYLFYRVAESLGLAYDMHWPFRQYESARGVRKSPLHGRLETLGACFGEVAGWERPNWYAPEGVEPRYQYSYKRQNWFDHSAAEHRAVREAVGLFDQTSFAKFLVQGRDAEAVLQRICANDVAVPVDRVVYTQWLNDKGGIEADLTVVRLAEAAFLVVTGAAAAVHDHNWLMRHIPDDANVTVTDVTSGYAVIGVMGPNSRALISRVTGTALANESFPLRRFKGDRDRLRAGSRDAHLLRRRAGMGALHPHRICPRRVRCDRRRGWRSRTQARRHARHGFAAHREGVPPLGP